MIFRTKIPLENSIEKFSHKDNFMCIGSCFAENIANKLQLSKFETLVNPFGINFHPIAIDNTFQRIYSRTHYSESEIFNHNGVFFSWDHSTAFSKPKLNDALENINHKIDEANEFLHKTSVFIFTLGTAWTYLLKDGNFYVNNCHKIPQKLFKKELLKIERIEKSIQNLIMMAKDVNPKAKIVFTISPVRHIKDGIHENNLSKSTLFIALNNVLKNFKDIAYFPSYEIIIDELRDYRFFAKDMAHPNDLAIDYIWEKFSDIFFDESTTKLIEQIRKIYLSINHKPIHSETLAYKKFLYETLKKVENLQDKLPKNSCKAEIELLKKQIHHAYR